MNINHQFPPSSPLLNGDLDAENLLDIDSNKIKCLPSKFISKQHQQKQPFNNKDNTRDDAYLTPDPSSSLGDVTVISDNSIESEGSYLENDFDAKTPEQESNNLPISKKLKSSPNVNIGKFSVIDVTKPLSASNFQNVIHVPLNGDSFKIGRSGLSCSFKLNSSNKLISRVHAEIQYEKSSGLIILKCLGFNGLNITIPKQINVDHIEDKTYRISFNEIQDTDDECASSTDFNNESRILNKNTSFTNFYMLKDETIEMPMIEGTVLDFRGELALLVYNTKIFKIDPETHEISTSTISTIPKAVKQSRRLSTDQLSQIVEQKKLQFSTHPTLKEMQNKKDGMSIAAKPIEKKNLANTIIYKRPSPLSTPSQSPSKMVPKFCNTITVNNKISNPITSLDNVADKENFTAWNIKKQVMSKSADRVPLSDVTSKQNIKLAIASKMNKDPKITKQSKTDITVQTEKQKFSDMAFEQSINEAIDIKCQSMNQTLNKPNNSIPLEKESSRVQSVEPKEVDDLSEQKKRGRPKKAKQTEEEVLRNMPKDEIEKILSTVPEIDDISNLITNHIAYSRVLQTPFSSIRDLNSIKKHDLSKLQLRCVLIHYIDCIGVIFRQGKDAAGKTLDEEYYYVPEKDLDKQRVQLVEELKGSSSHLRSCRKTHKQYFWKKPKI
jgi:pSer/pThr/pTyr-binding forkhead associated (FHA) protein